MKKRIKFLIPVVVILILCVGLFLYFRPLYNTMKQDLQRLQAESYDTVFFSMYPVNHYQEEDYTYFRAMDIVKAELSIPNEKLLQKYVTTAFESGNPISTAYLGVQPDKLSPLEVADIVEDYPGTLFEIILPYPQISYWTELKEQNCSEMLQCYQDFATALMGYENAQIYLFAGTQWLVCNPGNYTDTFQTNEDISRTLMCNTDNAHGYLLTPDTVTGAFQQLQQLVQTYREAPLSYPDASQYDIVFLGDSIMGNYTDSASVPGVVQGLTGAQVYNCGYGGEGAALSEQTEIPLPDIVNAIINHTPEILPREVQVYKGVDAFLNRENPCERLMFVINYGLNDYFTGVPVDGEDTYDITTYTGALRQAVKDLQAAYPEARILLNTPTFTVYFENGEQIMSASGGQLVDYVEAVKKVGQELDVAVLDTYSLMPTTAENWQTYLTDGCHPNETGRFLLGSFIADCIEK